MSNLTSLLIKDFMINFKIIKNIEFTLDKFKCIYIYLQASSEWHF